MNTVARFAAAAIMVTAGFGLTSVGTAASARADDPPWPFVGYHWCPGQPFDPAWGPAVGSDHLPRRAPSRQGRHDSQRRLLGPSPFQDWPEIPNNRP